ncbi:urease accessory protein UreD [Pseudonocardia spinosispora]|uniref:urease accessory protein UreD n=1 Tax=Pseudonocardia spinosispora TaxID=103441 RepID=UPI0003F50CDC|nr:urease accessory protein UreD [Pseudonocardia spinosispora]
MRASAELEVSSGQRIRWSVTPPVVLRRTGPARVHLVQAAGGPLDGDRLELTIRLAEGTELTVATAGATVAQRGLPGAGPALWTVRAQVAEGARLRWLPEPTVVCDGAHLDAALHLELADGAAALVREEVQLGRHGQRGGRYRGALAVNHAGEALLRHRTVLDGTDRALTGPGGTAGARVLTTLLGAGAQPEPDPMPQGEHAGARWAHHSLPGPGWLLLALSDTRAAAAHLPLPS